MIIYKCDICKKTTNQLDTIILYKNKIDYCEECKDKVEKIKQQFKREKEYRNICFDSALKAEETKIIKALREDKC